MLSRFATMLIVLACWQCSPPPAPSHAELVAQFNNQLRPQLLGSWQFKQVQVSATKLGWSPNYTGITRDTTLQNLAEMILEPFTEKVFDERVLNLGGSLRFQGRAYPIEVKVYPMLNVAKTKGVMWVAFKYDPQIDYNSADVKFMESLGLVNANFNFDTEFGQPFLTLQTTDKGLALASLVKK
jgi:hypothetical protein